MNDNSNKLLVCPDCGYESNTESYCKNNTCTGLGSRPLWEKPTSLNHCVEMIKDIVEYSKSHYINPDGLFLCAKFIENYVKENQA